MTTSGVTTQDSKVIKSFELETANTIRRYRLESQGNSGFIRSLGLLIKKMYEDDVLSDIGKEAYENSSKEKNLSYESLAVNFSELILKASRKA
ncbi:hypothetical protein [Priestia megaterium]|uniref:Uncharacterized protein n=1 Tax=Priestia megaterium TaxID=1404 RepID=A0A6M6E778_PRIMG|nr:hypothetical protein [Priestia megaterium]QJX80407.1 hypothetical protein FDZ14_30435 [Priestia megaterium]